MAAQYVKLYQKLLRKRTAARTAPVVGAQAVNAKAHSHEVERPAAAPHEFS
jgi:hypothetical protein